MSHRPSRYGVVVLGAGEGALRAALAAAATQRVALITQLPGHALEAGGLEEDPLHLIPPEEIATTPWHIHDVRSGVSYEEAISASKEVAAEAASDLTSMGVDIDFDSIKTHKTRRGETGRAWPYVSRLLYRFCRVAGVDFFPERIATNLLVGSGQSRRTVQGVQVYDLGLGSFETLAAPAVIIATDGFTRMFTNGVTRYQHTGDGIVASRRAGFHPVDLDRISVHPLRLFGSPFLLPRDIWGCGARLLGRYDVVADSTVHDWDTLTGRVFQALEEDQGWEAGYVGLDISPMTLEGRERLLAPVYDLVTHGYQIDMSSDLVPVVPAPRFVLGGISTDVHGQVLHGSASSSPVCGFFAIGESASIQGAGVAEVGPASYFAQITRGRAIGELAAGVAAESDVPHRTESLRDARSESIVRHVSNVAQMPADPSTLLFELRKFMDKCLLPDRVVSRSCDPISQLSQQLSMGPEATEEPDHEVVSQRRSMELDLLLDLSKSMLEPRTTRSPELVATAVVSQVDQT